MPEILVQVRPSSQAAGNLSPSPRLEALKDRIDDITATLQLISAKVGTKLNDLYQQTPESSYSIDEIELKLTIELECGAGVVVATGKATAGFEASLKWKRHNS